MPMTIAFDGASRGNPGKAAAVAVCIDSPSYRIGRVAKEPRTNNVAEFHGLLLAIMLAKDMNLAEVSFRGDSQLVVKLMTGEYQASHPDMKDLLDKAREMVKDIPKWDIAWWRRSENALADKLCNDLLDKEQI